MKKCPWCLKRKSTKEFWKNKSTKDGLQVYCKFCLNAHRLSPKGEASIKRYRSSPKCKKTTSAYWKSPAGKAVTKRYHESEKGRARIRNYQLSPRGKIIGQKAAIKYRFSPKGIHKAFRSSVEKYGMSVEQYKSLEQKQNGLCGICGKKNILGRRLCIDHCHKTQKIRGLLCNGCNAAIGFLEDNFLLCKQAGEYLLAHRLLSGLV